MRTLFLVSQYGQEIQDEILKLLPEPADMAKVAFIYTARKPKMKINPDREHADKNLMNKAGFEVEMYDLEDKDYQEVRKDLAGFDVVYVAGGNSFFLLNAMHNCNFAQVIRELLDEGVIYIGESAGSLVCGPDIYTTVWRGNDVNEIGLRDFTGLYLISFGIVPHFDDKMTESLGRGIMMAPYKVKFLHDNEMLYVRDDKVEVIAT
jgi:dipeptidase E